MRFYKVIYKWSYLIVIKLNGINYVKILSLIFNFIIWNVSIIFLFIIGIVYKFIFLFEEWV